MSKLLVLAFTLSLVGCGSDGTGETSVDAAVDAVVATGPQVTVTAPATITRGTTFNLDVKVTNFTLVNPTSTPAPTPTAGTGHFHLYFDDATDYGAGWTPQVPVDTATTDVAGVHKVRIVLVGSNHVELVPKVESTAMFTLQ